MSYASCPTAVVDAPADLVWALLVDPPGWGSVFDVRVASVDPPGPAVVGQRVCVETGPRIFHLKVELRVIAIDLDHRRLRLDMKLPFGLTVDEDLRCTPVGDTRCRVDYRCNLDFPGGWRGRLVRVLVNQKLDAGPRDSLARVKRAPNDALRAETVTDANGRKPAMIDPSPELPDDMPIADVELPPKVREALAAAGLRTVGDIREAPDARILRIPNLGESSLALLRKTLGLPSSLGVRSDAAPILPRNDHRDG